MIENGSDAKVESGVEESGNGVPPSTTSPSQAAPSRKGGGFSPTTSGWLAIGSGLMLWLAHPGPGMGYLAWIALIPVILSITDARALWRAVWRGYLFGFVFLGTVWHWIGLTINAYTHSWLAPLGWFAVTAILATSYGVWGGLVWALDRRISRVVSIAYQPYVKTIAVGAAWVFVEYCRSLGPLATPWASLSYSQTKNLAIIQVANLGGGYLVSFLILLYSASMVYGWRYPDKVTTRRLSVGVGLVLFFALIYGIVQLPNAKIGKAVPIATVQTGFNCLPSDFNPASMPSGSAQASAFRRLADQATRGRVHPVLCLWPEGATPGDAIHDRELSSLLSRLSTDYEMAMVVGSGGQEMALRQISTGRILASPQERRGVPYADIQRVTLSRNMSILFAPNERSTMGDQQGGSVRPDDNAYPVNHAFYTKRQLVPFGEFIPFRWLMPSGLQQLFDYLPVDDVAGERATLLEFQDRIYGRISVGPFICFESLFPNCAREMTKAGANLLVTQSNDSWFPSEAALEQHLSAVVLRAVENNRCIVRSTMTGVTCFVDSSGYVYGRLPLKADGVSIEHVRLKERQTLYTRFGDWFVLLCLLYMMGVSLLGRMPFLGARRTSSVAKEVS